METNTLYPTVDETTQTAGITLDSLNIPLDWAIAYNHLPAGYEFVIGGVENGVTTCDQGTNDLLVVVFPATTAPDVTRIDFSGSGDRFPYFASAGSVLTRPLSGS